MNNAITKASLFVRLLDIITLQKLGKRRKVQMIRSAAWRGLITIGASNLLLGEIRLHDLFFRQTVL